MREAVRRRELSRVVVSDMMEFDGVSRAMQCADLEVKEYVTAALSRCFSDAGKYKSLVSAAMS